MRPEIAASASRRRVSRPRVGRLCEDGRLREVGVHDPYLRYPHSYTRRDIAIALQVADGAAVNE